MDKYRRLSNYATAVAIVIPLAFCFIVLLNDDLLTGLLGGVFVFFGASPVFAIALLAWYDGCRVTPVPVLLFLISLLYLTIIGSSHTNIHRLFSDISFVPLYISVLLIGTEWTLRRRVLVADFLRDTVGKASVGIGVLHVIAGIALNVRARPYEVERFLSISMDIHSIMNSFGIALVTVALFVVIVFPAFLWYHNRLLAPVGVITAWITLGAWLNYLWWDAHPVPHIRGLAAVPFLPAPDYAVVVSIPLGLILLTAVFEMALRESGINISYRRVG